MTGAQVRREPWIKRFGNVPQPIVLVLLAVAIGLAGGIDGVQVVTVFNMEFGRSLGGFALILIPSFILAACLTKQQLDGASGIMAVLSPVTAAGMVCPDTSYAALSAAAGRHKLSVAFGSFAGYRLLFPAGPLIVATGLGIDSPWLFATGLFLLVPVWFAGEVWARFRRDPAIAGQPPHPLVSIFSPTLARALTPLFVLGILLVIGGVFPLKSFPLLDFITHPKGALVTAAAVALIQTKSEYRRECMDTALRRSAWLLVVIGAASGFGGMLSQVIPLSSLLPRDISDGTVIFLLFAMTMVVKVVHGSSMVTFATATPLLAPVVLATQISPVAAVFAICLGSIAIMPTDSFYWLVRSDALGDRSEGSAVITMAGGALIQAMAGFSALYLLLLFGIN